MPMVYDLPTVGTSPQPMQQFQAPEIKDYSGAQLQEAGAAVTKAGVTLGIIQQKMQDDIDEATTREMDNRLADTIRTALYDPENGFLQTTGKTALDARPGVVKAIQDTTKKLEEGLQTDVQRYMFKKAATARLQSAYLHIDSHAMNQTKVYNATEAGARMNGARADALNNWAGWENPDGIYAKSKALMLVEADSVMSIAGIPKDSAQYKNGIQTATTALHTEVLTNMISLGQTSQAKAYFNANIQEILPDKIAEIRKTLKVAITATTADDMATDVWDKFMKGKTSTDAIPIFDMTQRVRELAGEDEDVQKAAIAGIKERAAEWNAQQAEAKAQNISGVWKQVDAGIPMKKIQLSPSWLALSPTERHQVRAQIESEAATRASRAAAQSSKELSELTRKEHLNFLKNGDEFLTATDPNTLKKMSRAQVEATRGKFGMTATQHLLDKWDAIQDPRKYGEAKMDADDFNQVAVSLNLNPYDTKNKDMRNRIGALRFHVEQAISFEQAARKAPLSRQEKIDLIKNELSKQVLIDPGVFSFEKKVPALSLTKDQAEKIVIPMAERQAISEAMKIMYGKTNNPAYAPTEANMRSFYLKSISPGAAVTFEGEE